MSRLYLLRDGRGDRQLDETALPLQVGGEGAVDLVVPGLDAGVVAAYVAVADGHPYLQPADAAVTLYHNHERVTGSRWLKSGDRVQVGSAGLLLWQVKGDQVFVSVERFEPPAAPPVASAEARRPPLAPPVAGIPPAAGDHPARRRWIGALVALLALVALFVLFAVPVAIEVEPEPESQTLHGLPGLPLAGRTLLLPGSYRLEARRTGYRPLEQALTIGRDGPRELRYRLEELPGRLQVRLQPAVPYTLWVDGAEVAPAAAGHHPVPRGRHLLRVESARHLPVETEVEIAGFGRPQSVALALRPAWAELTLDSRPTGAAVAVDGTPLGVTPLTAELLQGTRRLSLALPGHKTVRLDLPVTAGTPLRLDGVVLPPADGTLALTSTPAGATVTVDGDYRGTTPLELALAADQPHRLRLTLPGHRPLERVVEIAPERRQELALALPPELGTLFVSATPADAELLVDGRPAGSATQRLRLSTREHTLEFRRDGYASERVTVTPNASASQRIEVSLRTVAAARAAATPQSVTVAGDLRLELVRPGGPFRMGASRREAGRRANESARLVRLTQPFYLGVTEVTHAQYRRFDPAHDPGRGEGVPLGGDDQPVVGVTWDDAARYCNWLSRQQGLPEAYVADGERMVAVTPLNGGYRLPTEAEWAYAARVHGRPEPARYPWAGGYPPPAVVGNYADARIADTLADTVPNYDDGYRASAPVGRFAPQPGGFHDLGGNVAEWIHDYYAVYPDAAERLVSDPTGPADGAHHVVRGASWRFGSVTELRLTYRDYSRTARDDLGFRVARYAR